MHPHPDADFAGITRAITTAITTCVVLVVVAVSPYHEWQQPILRFADAVIGVAVGLAAPWTDLHVIRPRLKLASIS